jgi:hypothetical protein
MVKAIPQSITAMDMKATYIILSRKLYILKNIHTLEILIAYLKRHRKVEEGGNLRS